MLRPEVGNWQRESATCYSLLDTATLSNGGALAMGPLRFRHADLVTMSGLLLVLLLTPFGLLWGEGWGKPALLWFAMLVFGIGAVALRQRFPNRLSDVVWRFWPVPVIVVLHGTLNPIIDLLNPVLRDDVLMWADQQVFGIQPSVWAETRIPPVVFDVLMVAYASFYFWPVALGVILYVKGRPRQLDSVLHLYLWAFFLNFVCYVLVPVVGPRFVLAGAYSGEPQGWLVGTQIYQMFFQVAMIRDCFPSGHTGITLLTLWLAYRMVPLYFWVFLPVAVLLVSATVLARFHYTLDLVAAVPLILLAVVVWQTVEERLPRGVVWNIEASAMLDRLRF